MEVCAFRPPEESSSTRTHDDSRRLAEACRDIEQHQRLLRDATDQAYELLLKGALFPPNTEYYTTLEMLRWPEPRRVIARHAKQTPAGNAQALLGNIEHRHLRERTRELKQAAKDLRRRNADRFVDEYLLAARARVWRRFTDDLGSRICHQRWDFVGCFRLLAKSETQIAILYACTAGYRCGLNVAKAAAKAQSRLEAADRGRVVAMRPGTWRQFGAPPA